MHRVGWYEIALPSEYEWPPGTVIKHEVQFIIIDDIDTVRNI